MTDNTAISTQTATDVLDLMDRTGNAPATAEFNKTLLARISTLEQALSDSNRKLREVCEAARRYQSMHDAPLQTNRHLAAKLTKQTLEAEAELYTIATQTLKELNQ